MLDLIHRWEARVAAAASCEKRIECISEDNAETCLGCGSCLSLKSVFETIYGNNEGSANKNSQDTSQDLSR